MCNISEGENKSEAMKIDSIFICILLSQNHTGLYLIPILLTNFSSLRNYIHMPFIATFAPIKPKSTLSFYMSSCVFVGFFFLKAVG